MFHLFKKLVHWKEKKTAAPLRKLEPQQTVEDLDDAVDTSGTISIPTAQMRDKQGPVEDLYDTFHPYTRLAPELRLKIWRYYLEEETPQMYRFTLRYPLRQGMRGSRLWDVHPDDRVYIQPVKGFEEDEAKPMKCFMEPLKISTMMRRIASKTCVEARQIVLEMFPDTLKFRLLPQHWGDIRPVDRQWISHIERYPEHILRFTASEDIIIFNASLDDQAFIAEIARKSRCSVEPFLGIRNVGMAVESLKSWHTLSSPNQLPVEWICGENCLGPNCEDCDKKDPTRSFLSLFPSIQSLSIAGLPASSSHCLDNDENNCLRTMRLSFPSCPCGNGVPIHSWPLIRSSDSCGWFVIYNERSSCMFPKFSRIQTLRKVWKPDFPYHEVPAHVKIQFIQPWRQDFSQELDLCGDCIYKNQEHFGPVVPFFC
ncbi:hypothetical protein DL98DRAFT_593019 [Cadophora sp. DSE1049]|nr:hypothetical protein DL98DRAFT_593019 [Cadophora sp. DSE1049]